MTAFHEIDVALSVSVPAPFSAVRIPAAEVHVNPWMSGSKGAPSITVGSPTNSATTGLIMVPQRLTSLSNAPSELVLGDASGAWVINLAEGEVVSAFVTNLSLVYLP